jgi:hypothetical protein
MIMSHPGTFDRIVCSLGKPFLVLSILMLVVCSPSRRCWALASNNIPLDSPVYSYLEKLSGLGLVSSEIKGNRPYAKAEVARLLREAEDNLANIEGETASFAAELIERVRESVPREAALRDDAGKAPFLDYNPLSGMRLRYVNMDGQARSYNRQVFVRGGQSAFGFIGGKLRPDSDAEVLTQSGSEGTPLLENNEGVTYRRGSNGELNWSMEGYVTDKVSLLLEPDLLFTPETARAFLRKGYVKVGSGGLELEVGRDANWFGPGYRGATTLTNNAKNLDAVKLSSPEPVDVAWVKHYLGDFKYSLIFARLGETGTGQDLRHPYFIGIKFALKPRPWYEIGLHFMRMEGGPGFEGRNSTLQDAIFGGGFTNKNASTAGIDLRFRIPWLRNTEIYGDYSGSDSALFWPIVESYVAGVYIPLLTKSGKDDFRFEYFYGNPKLYVDDKFPAGFVYNGLPFGHSQGGAAQEFFTRYSHWFSTRNLVALEYFHTDRGREGRVGAQQTEEKNAFRSFWSLPVYGDLDMDLMYGWERIDNFNLVAGSKQTNQTLKVDLRYRY